MPNLPQPDLVALARDGAQKSGLPAALIYAMILKESSGNPDAQHKNSGARGLMQLKAAAAGEHGVGYDELFDPEKNVEAGSGYLARMMERFEGDPKRALSAYNVGPGNTRKFEGAAPAAQPYIDTISGTIAQVTGEGQPFADEVNPEAGPLPNALHRQRVAKVLNDLLRQEPVQVPMRQTGLPPTYDSAGITRMLSGLNFAQ